MSNQRTITREISRLQIDHIGIWKQVLTIAVLSNNYDVDVKIRVLLYLKLGLYSNLMSWASTISAEAYENADLHFRMVQLSSLIRKYPLDPKLTGLDPEGEARKKFRAAERRCRHFNRYFRTLRVKGDRRPSVSARMRAYIAYVLGETRDSTGIGEYSIAKLWAQVRDLCDYGNGANVGVHGNATHLLAKLRKEWTCTPAALPFARDALWANHQIADAILMDGSDPANVITCWDREVFSSLFSEKVLTVRYNNISFVPKTAKTHRVIAVEPVLNSFLQKGVDVLMRRRLARVGLDLRKQEPNQLLAYQGSLGGEDPYCTIDLSSASDNIASEVVRSLLPPGWFDLLNSIRSPAYRLDGEVRTYEKFVSMGNGFCFPLQTLIFASVCHAVALELGVEPDFRVYGDDIIVRRSVASTVLEVLREHGFQPNPDKTFLEGPFRESCGADWFGGENVRPVELKKNLDTLRSIFTLHNETLRRNIRCKEYFREIREFLRLCVPRRYFLATVYDPSEPDISSLPGELGYATIDGAFWVSLDVAMTSKYVSWDADLQRWKFMILRTSPVVDRVPPAPFIEWAALLRTSGGNSGAVDRNGRVRFTLRYSTAASSAWQ